MGLCERCKKAQATFHITKIDSSNEKLERHLCERCSIEEGHVQTHKGPPLPELLVEHLIGMKPSAQAIANLVCPECELSYVEFRNQGPLGCPNDYDAFESELASLVERAQDGATQHIGKTPRSFGQPRPKEQDLQSLRRELSDAIAAEDYERAAKLRDQIHKLESE
ncbi:MAG: UvrB/UvrC motif-containing protein [Planctomycetes bacterium]|nr:UvrB/UvrC motif-containing protein [Planctomycetota bacterium]